MIFTRTGEEEARAKSFVPQLGRHKNKHIADQLIWHAIVTAQRTRLPIHTIYSHEQRGNSFGVRLANAIEDVFSLGYDRVITMGNDCPSLTSELILDVRDKLYQSELVLGPTPDGGTYLIGIGKSAYNRSHFIKMRWQTTSLLQDFEEYAKAYSVEFLENASDINTAKDFVDFIKLLDTSCLLYQQLVHVLIAPQYYDTFYIYFYSLLFFYTSRPLRAPPQVVIL